MDDKNIEEIVLAAGCFWHIQAVFDKLSGVIFTEVGYTGGTVKNPDYKMVCRGDTGHAEAVKIKFDTTQITFNEILDIFWQSHDPTTKDRQGPDRGTQYRSAIFYSTEEQKKTAVCSLADWQKSKNITAQIVTDITPIEIFYQAEEYHQHYFKKN